MRMLMSSGPPVAVGPSTQFSPGPRLCGWGKKKVLVIGPGSSRGRVPISKTQPWLGSQLFQEAIPSGSLPLPHQVLSPSHSEPGPLAQPPISGACAPGPGRDRSPGRPSSRFFPAPASLPPGATAPWSPGTEARGGHPPGRSHMLPRTGPRVPSRSGRPPRSPARPGRPGAPPAARPCRRTGGRDRLLLRKFQERCGPQRQTVSWVDCSPIPVSAGCSADPGTKKRPSSCMRGPVE
ncbi:uncharacterized protein LOC121828212 [Peromyscus maniculatus bairdii]|uniref:uncharacterized protein LOC121828212 n=1 Tax=Peromyscus maniculatus bairdii TaxID=230844 RepID=UPI003FD07021